MQKAKPLCEHVSNNSQCQLRPRTEGRRPKRRTVIRILVLRSFLRLREDWRLDQNHDARQRRANDERYRPIVVIDINSNLETARKPTVDSEDFNNRAV